MNRLVVALAALAMAIPASGSRLGYHVDINVGRYDVHDPVGDVAPKVKASLSAGSTWLLSQKYQVGLWSDYGFVFGRWSTVGADKLSLQATSLYTNQVLQIPFGRVHSLHLFGGLGLGVGLNDYTDRKLSDADGYIAETLDDRSSFAINGIGQLGIMGPRLPIQNGRYRLSIKPGVMFQATIPARDDFTIYELKTFILF